jgi:ABC-type glutathione transport system ATPase component
MALSDCPPTTADSTPKIAVENVSNAYKSGGESVQALSDVSFSVDDGEFCCVVGPSGCGKTTLLRTIAGLERPDSGSVQVDGECKYTTREMHEGDLADLEQSASQVEWTPPNGAERTHHYCCFCRSGFSDGLQDVADTRDDVSLFTPDSIVFG